MEKQKTIQFKIGQNREIAYSSKEMDYKQGGHLLLENAN